MKIIILLGVAILVSACTVEERDYPYFSRYDNRDVVIVDEPNYIAQPHYYRHHHRDHDRVRVRY